MSTSATEAELLGSRDVTFRSDVELLANDVIALFEEFEAPISEGRLPTEFSNRLADLQTAAERLAKLSRA
jgi:hypothetical protein